MTSEEAIARARGMLKVPFLHLGRNEHGIDCIGLVAFAYAYPKEKLPPYPRDPRNGQLEAELDRALGQPVGVYGESGAQGAALVPGQVVALAYARLIRHVGLVAAHPALPGCLSLIHTDSTLGRVTEHLLDAKWLRRIRRVYQP